MIIKKNYDISNISYIKVGGIVKRYIVLDNLLDVLKLKNDFIAISNTSKILFCFDYLNKDIIKFTINKIIINENDYFIYAGCPLIKAYLTLKEQGISGFEYIATIPGLIGGSIVNNASFLNQSISDNLIKVLVYEEGKFYFLKKNECEFLYRNSNLKRENFLIVGALFQKVYIDKLSLESSYEKALNYRKIHQSEFRNTLGSTFKNQDDLVIGKVLDELGYKGYCYSKNVKISDKHGNFIIVKNKTHYLEIYSFIDYLKRLLYYYLEKNISLEIIFITEHGYKY